MDRRAAVVRACRGECRFVAGRRASEATLLLIRYAVQQDFNRQVNSQEAHPCSVRMAMPARAGDVTAAATDAGKSAVPKPVQERADATKAYLEAQLLRRRQELAEKQQRRREAQRQLAQCVSDEERTQVLAAFEEREKQISREARKRLTPADFENLVVIGRGAFGEVR